MRVQPEKGSLTALENGQRSRTYTFWYNPETVDEDIEAGFSNVKIPGLPVPLKQYSGGGSHTISLKIILAPLGDHPVEGTVEDAITNLKDIMMPGYARQGDLWNPRGPNPIQSSPHVLIFNFGRIEFPCVLKSLKIQRKFFDRELNTTVAELSLKLERVISAYMR